MPLFFILLLFSVNLYASSPLTECINTRSGLNTTYPNQTGKLSCREELTYCQPIVINVCATGTCDSLAYCTRTILETTCEDMPDSIKAGNGVSPVSYFACDCTVSNGDTRVFEKEFTTNRSLWMSKCSGSTTSPLVPPKPIPVANTEGLYSGTNWEKDSNGNWQASFRPTSNWKSEYYPQQLEALPNSTEYIEYNSQPCKTGYARTKPASCVMPSSPTCKPAQELFKNSTGQLGYKCYLQTQDKTQVENAVREAATEGWTLPPVTSAMSGPSPADVNKTPTQQFADAVEKFGEIIGGLINSANKDTKPCGNPVAVPTKQCRSALEKCQSWLSSSEPCPKQIMNEDKTAYCGVYKGTSIGAISNVMRWGETPSPIPVYCGQYWWKVGDNDVCTAEEQKKWDDYKIGSKAQTACNGDSDKSEATKNNKKCLHDIRDYMPGGCENTNGSDSQLSKDLDSAYGRDKVNDSSGSSSDTSGNGSNANGSDPNSKGTEKDGTTEGVSLAINKNFNGKFATGNEFASYLIEKPTAKEFSDVAMTLSNSITGSKTGLMGFIDKMKVAFVNVSGECPSIDIKFNSDYINLDEKLSFPCFVMPYLKSILLFMCGVYAFGIVFGRR